MYVKRPIEDAVREALNILGRPSNEWDQDGAWAKRVAADENLWAMRYETDEAIYTLRAALDMPVPQNVCNVCGTRDAIYWSRDPGPDAKAPQDNPDQKMWCHGCGTVEPDSQWVTEVLG